MPRSDRRPPPLELVDFDPHDWSDHRCEDCLAPELWPACAFYRARAAWESEYGSLTPYDVESETRLPDMPWHHIEEEI